MTRLALLLVALVAPLLVAGCSTTDSRSDAERILGTRTAAVVNVRLLSASVPVYSLEATTPASQSTFAAGGAATIRLALPDTLSINVSGIAFDLPLPDEVALAGTYSLDEANDRVTIARTDVGGAVTLRYVFRGSDDLELIAEDADAIAALLGAAGPEAAVLAGRVQGVSVRFNL